MKRILAISLLLIFISGQVNLTWATHYCGEIPVSNEVMLGHGSLDCGMGMEDSCETNATDFASPQFKSASCCSNDYYSVDTVEDFQRAENSLETQIIALTSIIATPDVAAQKLPIKYYHFSSPPWIPADLQVRYQTFLL